MRDWTEAQRACFMLSAFACFMGALAALVSEGIPGSAGQRGLVLILPFLVPALLAATVAVRNRRLAVSILAGGLLGALSMFGVLFLFASALMVS